MDEAAKAVRAAFDAAEKSLQDAQRDVIEKKEECKKKLELKCDNCKSLKCKQAEDDCKGFMDAAGKWIGKALSSVSDSPKVEGVFPIIAYTERLRPKVVLNQLPHVLGSDTKIIIQTQNIILNRTRNNNFVWLKILMGK